jgi:hypothetical protein
MLRLLNVLAIVVLVGSAVYAYTVKYATLYQAERMVKMKHELQTEKDSLAMLRAEWAHVANPVRIETLADQLLGGQVMQLAQIATLAGLPDKGARGDEIGAQLLSLGLSDPAPDAKAAPAPKPAPAVAAKPGAKTVVAAKPAPKGVAPTTVTPPAHATER